MMLGPGCITELLPPLLPLKQIFPMIFIFFYIADHFFFNLELVLVVFFFYFQYIKLLHIQRNTKQQKNEIKFVLTSSRFVSWLVCLNHVTVENQLKIKINFRLIQVRLCHYNRHG